MLTEFTMHLRNNNIKSGFTFFSSYILTASKSYINVVLFLLFMNNLRSIRHVHN